MNVGSIEGAFEIAAVSFAGLSGVIDARRKNLDLVGAFVVGLVTAFGGGTLRDVLLARRPLFWIAHYEYTLIVLGLAVLYLYAPRILQPLTRPRAQLFVAVLDAVALGLFGGLGVQAALDLDNPPFIAVLFGVMTGTFGGVLRDVVLNEIPMLFRPTTALYATAAFAGGIAHIGAVELDVASPWPLAIGAFVTIALRLAALRFDWKLPPARPFEEG